MTGHFLFNTIDMIKEVICCDRNPRTELSVFERPDGKSGQVIVIEDTTKCKLEKYEVVCLTNDDVHYLIEMLNKLVKPKES